MGITKKLRNRRWLLAALLLVPGLPASVYAARHLVSVGVQPDGSILVPIGQTLTPAGTTSRSTIGLWEWSSAPIVK